MSFRVSVHGVAPEEMAQRLNALSQRDVNVLLAETAIDLITEGMDQSKDPYGEAYEELVTRDGLPLIDSAGMRNSWARGETADDFVTVVNGKDYVDYHQEGTGIFGRFHTPIVPTTKKALSIPKVGAFASVRGTPQRKMIPDDGDLPDAWAEEYDETIVEYIDGVLNE